MLFVLAREITMVCVSLVVILSCLLWWWRFALVGFAVPDTTYASSFQCAIAFSVRMVHSISESGKQKAVVAAKIPH